MPERNRKRKREEKENQQIDLTKDEPKQKKRKTPKSSSIKKKVINDSSKQECASTSNTTNIPNEKLECSICYEIVKEQGSLDCCAHIFCFACIHRWSNSSNTCPICKQRFKSIEKKQLEETKGSKKGKKKKPIKVRVPTRNFRADDEYFDDDDDNDTVFDIIHSMVQDVFRSVVELRHIVPQFAIPRHLNLGTPLPSNPNEPIEISDDEEEDNCAEDFHREFLSDIFELQNAMDIRNFTPGFVPPFMRPDMLPGRYRQTLPQPIQPPHHPMFSPPMMQRMPSEYRFTRFNFVDMTPRDLQRHNSRMVPQMSSPMMSRTMPPMMQQQYQHQMPHLQVPQVPQRVQQIPQMPQIPQIRRPVPPMMNTHPVNIPNQRNVNQQNFVQHPFTPRMNNQPNAFPPPFPDFNQLLEMFNTSRDERTSVPINDVLNNLNQFK